MLATNRELLDSLRARLATPTNLTVADKYYDLYEGYLFALVVEAARTVVTGTVGSVYFEDGAENRVTDVVLRTSPGRLNGPNARPYTHAVVDLGDPQSRDLEIHLGVYFAGSQRVPHECDIAVVTRSEAQRARANAVYPRSWHLKLAFEAKYRESNLRLAVGREFIGLRTQLRGDSCLLVTNSLGPKTARMLSKRAAFRDEVVPDTPTDAELSHFARTVIRSHVRGTEFRV